MNQNANPGTALPGEGFSGPLVGGSLSLVTPLGEATTGVVGSSIAFERLACEADNCLFMLTALEVDFDDFGLGPFVISDLHAELVGTAIGIIRDDMTATIDDRSMRVQATLGLGVKINVFGGKLLFSDKKAPILATNDGPVTMSIDTDNNLQLVEASFAFPSSIKTRLANTSANCTPEQQ
jgi:hypothetical protein